MQQIIDYILCNWCWLLPVVLSVVESVFIIILKKRPFFNLEDHYWADIYSILPSFINEAERECNSGVSKMAYVLNLLVKSYPEIFRDSYALKQVRNAIEEILETPQKKGGK